MEYINIRVDTHGVNKHGVDKHGVDKHGVVKHGVDKLGVDKHVVSKHGKDKHVNIKKMENVRNFVHNYGWKSNKRVFVDFVPLMWTMN